MSDELPLEDKPNMTFREMVAVTPKEQKFRYTITPINSGLMNAKLIGEQMMTVAKIMEKIATEDGPRMLCALSDLSMTDKGEVVMDFIILSVKDKAMSQNRKTKSKK